MDQTEVQHATRSVLVAIVLAAVALVLMGVVSDHLLLRARPIHRPALVCAQPAMPVASVEPAALAPVEPATSPVRTTVRSRGVRRAVQESAGQAASELLRRTEACKADPLCGLRGLE